ncbi:c-type cytochrome [Pseudohalioglobus lutimaris]|uniref:Cytochrome C n=1 Tax=Pseudohalioglobus lutimaris TaxID=1737061 RepID=A0A2N5WZP4_9GAMM|nr:cytochrome C [Pseudohalioglobus lutimaris]PLW67686.1 cytochrome C [Pseudohalioglobus lutimaris]
MIIKRKTHYLLSLFVVAGASLAQDPTIDRMIAAQCAQCHGTDGHATGDIDSIAGKDTADLYHKLIDMEEDRAEDIMEHQAWGYTDEQLYRIARYYSTVPESDDEDREDEDDD